MQGIGLARAAVVANADPTGAQDGGGRGGADRLFDLAGETWARKVVGGEEGEPIAVQVRGEAVPLVGRGQVYGDNDGLNGWLKALEKRLGVA